jgi:hypothetical protein
MARTAVTHQGRTVVLPKGVRKLGAKQMDILDAQLTASEWNAAKKKTCRVVFFTAGRVGVRCKGRSLSTQAARRFKAMKRAKQICLKAAARKKVMIKRGPRKGQKVKLPGWKFSSTGC